MKINGYDKERRRKKIAEITTAIIVGMIDNGEIDGSDESIQKALPKAARTAKAALDAAEEFIS